MYKDQLLFNNPKNEIETKILTNIESNEIKQNETEPNETELNETELNETELNETELNETESNNDIKEDDIKDTIKLEWSEIKKNNKVTIKVLKELLLRLDLKVSGKKDELQKRLESRLNNCVF
jgi:hypothetical protein